MIMFFILIEYKIMIFEINIFNLKLDNFSYKLIKIDIFNLILLLMDII